MFKRVTEIEYNAILELEKQRKTKITLVSDARINRDHYTIENNK